MKIIVFFIFSLFGSQLVSQTSFSIEPLINYKINICNYLGNNNLVPLFQPHNQYKNENPYYTFYAKKVGGQYGFNVGLRALGSFKNGKRLLSFEWSIDATDTKSKVRSLTSANYFGIDPIPENKVYSWNTSVFGVGFTYNRLTFGYHHSIFTDKFNSKMYLSYDLSVLYGPKNEQFFYYEGDKNSTSRFYHNDSELLSREYFAYFKGITNYSLGVGLRSELNIKKNNQNIYLFNIDLNFRQGLKMMMFTSETFLINDSGKELGFINTIISRGSGIYFQISRKFQLYPWRPTKKTKLEHE
jgi:hypothetical protein